MFFYISPVEKLDTEFFELKSLVKSLKLNEEKKYVNKNDESHFNELENIITNEPIYNYKELQFNINRQLILVNNGSLTTKYFINEDGTYKECFMGDLVKPWYKIIYFYDNLGQIKEEVVYNHYIFELYNEWDIEGKPIWTDKPKITERLLYTYNENGQLEKRIKDKVGNNTPTLITKYDKYGNIIEQINSNFIGSVLNYHKFYKYNNDNLLISKEWTDYSSISYADTQVTKDNDGNYQLVDALKKTENLFHTLCSFTYNEYGDFCSKKILITTKNGISYENEIIYKYQYDGNGNWVEKYGFIDGKEVYKANRIIEYFD